MVATCSCGSKEMSAENPGDHLSSPIAICGAGIEFSTAAEATLNAELKQSSAGGSLTAGFKRAARTAVELKDNEKYASYLTCVCKQSKIQSCDTAPPES
jgi:hypothetical protein